MLGAGRLRGVRIIAAHGAAAVVWGWGVARYPVLLPGTAVTLTNAGGQYTALVALIVVFIVVVLLVGVSPPCYSPCKAATCSAQTNTERRPLPRSHTRASQPQHRPQPPPAEHRRSVTGVVVLGLIAIGAIVRRRKRR